MRNTWVVGAGLMVCGCVDKATGGSDTGASTADAQGDNGPEEGLDLPDDPGSQGVPVGVRTVQYEGETLEVWYPATDATGTEGTPVDFNEFLPTSFLDHVGGVTLPLLPSVAVRDATPRSLAEPVPVVFFSHGFGGMRVQSFAMTSHLASRGYVVIAPDHPGRMLPNVLPCMFAPALDGCDLSGFGGLDPALADMETALAWVDEMADSGDLAGLIDPNRLGLLGHSAGAGTVTALGEDGERFSAIAAMAGGAAVERDVPVLRMDGTCDGFVGAADESTLSQLTDGRVVQVSGAGHLAFSNLCDLELGRLADEVVAVQPDVNELLFGQMRSLAVDGCPGEEPLVDEESCADGFLSLDASDEVLFHYITTFMDQALKGTGPGVVADQFDAAVVWTQSNP